MSIPPNEERTGEYVYQPPYLEMRLRMRLTGKANPSQREWAEALTKLLNDLGD
jgi:hypothetical protein